MCRHLLFATLLLLLLFGCSTIRTSGESDSAGPATEMTAIRAGDLGISDALVVERFHNRLDSVVSLFQFGDLPNFFLERDLFEKDFIAFTDTMRRPTDDPDIVWVQEKLNLLDKLIASRDCLHPYLAEMDSLALAYEKWPENDIPYENLLKEFAHDTLFRDIHNKKVDFWIRYFCGPGRSNFERSLYRMELYRPTIEKILGELDLPKDLICIALIESGFNLKARSRAKAVGPWQFIRGTARLYGLRVNWWLDERRDIIASTYAAGNYLKDLYALWDCWFLAMAAYNAGEYRVARAIARQRTENYWKLRLPKQTQRYVPKFLAALYIARDPEKYGFRIPKVEPASFDHVTVKDATDLKLIAKSAGVSVEVIKDLNPSLLRWCTPPKMEVSVKVPLGSAEQCRTQLSAIPPEKRVTWRRHRIRKGETLSLIARKYSTSISALKSLNGIRNSHFIREGWALIVPMKGAYAEIASAKPEYKSKRRSIDKKALDAYAKRSAPPSGYKKVLYTVKDRDTLGEIAELYHTSARKLRQWNDLSYRSYIYPGQKLIIYVPESFKQKEAPLLQSKRPSGENMVKSSYVVKKGDTIYSISKRFNVRVSDLLVWNGKNRRALIHPGEILEIWKEKSN